MYIVYTVGVLTNYSIPNKVLLHFIVYIYI